VNDLIEVAKTFGVPVAILVYFLWRDYRKQQKDDKKEDAITKRLRDLEDCQRGQMMDMITKQNLVAEKTADIMRESIKAKQSLIDILKTRPCIADEVVGMLKRGEIGYSK
jgi:hypothetical protein